MNTSINIQLSLQQIDLLRRGESVNICIHCEGCGAPATLPAKRGEGLAGTWGMLLQFFPQQVERLQTNGNIRTSETYRAACNKLRAFVEGNDLEAAVVDAETMEAMQSFLRRQQLSMNSISFYIRIVRAVYHRAVEQGMFADCRPFVHVFTGSQPTAKRALSLDEIRRIRQLSLTDNDERFARDLFLLSFYTRGMSFVDLAYLKKTDIRNGTMVYTRRKTGRMLTMRWEEAMQRIVDCHPSSTCYLLPIIHTVGRNERNQYRTVQDRVNRLLKCIARKAAIVQNLTMYCARHSWATIAREQRMPVSVISHAMGHNSESITEVYLKSIDSGVIDSCNSEIIGLLEQERALGREVSAEEIKGL